MNEQLVGIVQRVFFASSDGRFCAFLIKTNENESFSIVANTKAPKVGEDLLLTGCFVVHPKYGKQFKAESLQKSMPTTEQGAKRFLENLEIRGLGEKSINKILSYFGARTCEVLSEKAEDILLVPGIREKIKQELYSFLVGSGFLTDIILFLEEHGVSSKWAGELYDIYGEKAIDVLRKNPYVLMHIENGASFSVADILATRLGFFPNDEVRLQAGIREYLYRMEEGGNTCVPVEEIMANGGQILGGYEEEITGILESMLESEELILCEHEEMQYIYLRHLYEVEIQAVDLTLGFLKQTVTHHLDITYFISVFEKAYGIKFGDIQKKAIEHSICKKFSVITGGPGTGKTTIIKALVQAFQKMGYNKITLAAPTGRAAKRLNEATAFPASTIHRLLHPIMKGEPYEFEFNEDNQLQTDVVIVDEASMLNIQLYRALMAAIPETAHVVLVGDVDQLPPIGPGFVLRDLLYSGQIPFTQLSEVYRQKEANRIIENAHKINFGQMPDMEETEDFLFIPVKNIEEMRQALIKLYKSKVEETEDIQTISPMRKGDGGSTHLSKLIQETINPHSNDKPEIKLNGVTYRVGDKVIQVENNYSMEVFNGEIGTVFAITPQYMAIKYPDKEMVYDLSEPPNIMLAYAITVHKSQGSEYKTVVIPFISAYHIMLQRNLLYTAVTRAKKKVIIIGSEGAVRKAVETIESDWRYTLFKERLCKEI